MQTQTKTKTTQFIEVEVRENDSEETKPDESTFYFKCTSCHLPAQATNGHQIFKDPNDPMGDPKGFEVNYIFCHRCEILENMNDKEFDTFVVYAESNPPSPQDKAAFSRKIREDLFSN